MALVLECTVQCVPIVIDNADIVRDGDLSPVETIAYQLAWITSGLPTNRPMDALRA